MEPGPKTDLMHSGHDFSWCSVQLIFGEINISSIELPYIRAHTGDLQPMRHGVYSRLKSTIIKQAPSKIARHQAVNDVIARARTAAGVPDSP